MTHRIAIKFNILWAICSAIFAAEYYLVAQITAMNTEVTNIRRELTTISVMSQKRFERLEDFHFYKKK